MPCALEKSVWPTVAVGSLCPFCPLVLLTIEGSWNLPVQVGITCSLCICLGLYFVYFETLFIIFFKIFFIYLIERERAEACRLTSRGGGRSRLLAEQGAQPGARRQDPRITTKAESRCLTNWATQELLKLCSELHKRLGLFCCLKQLILSSL